jgi:hypothetical protein
LLVASIGHLLCIMPAAPREKAARGSPKVEDIPEPTAGEHDGALRRLEYRRHLVFAGAELDLKRAFWEWSIYGHLADLG